MDSSGAGRANSDSATSPNFLNRITNHEDFYAHDPFHFRIGIHTEMNILRSPQRRMDCAYSNLADAAN